MAAARLTPAPHSAPDPRFARIALGYASETTTRLVTANRTRATGTLSPDAAIAALTTALSAQIGRRA